MTGAMPSAESPPFRPNRRGVPVRKKLLVTAVAANLAGMLAAVHLSNLIRAVPAEASTETLLLVLYYTALCVVAVVDALLIDEMMFAGAFRLTHLQGKDPKYAKASDEAEVVAATMQRSTASFPVVLILCGGITYLLFNAVNRDFNVYYRRVGVHVSALRGDDPEGQPRRLQAIAELSVRRETRIIPTLQEQLRRGGEIAGWAAWALGRFTDVKAERKSVMADLQAAAKGADPTLRREALLALSRYQDRGIADALAAEFDRDLQAGVFDERLLLAAGHIQVPSLLPKFVEVLARGEERDQRLAAWAIGQLRDQRDTKDLDKLLAERMPAASLQVRCAIVDAFGLLAKEEGNLPLVHAYEAASPAELATKCEPVTVRWRPDRGDDHFDLFLPADTYQNKIFGVLGQIRATSPDIRAVVEPFLERVIAASRGDGTLTTSRAQSLLDGIRTARDDSKFKAEP